MLRADPRSIVSGVETVIYFYTNHNNWTPATVLSLAGTNSGDYINVEQVAYNSMVVRIKSSVTGGSLTVTDPTNNEATQVNVLTPAQFAALGQPLPGVYQSQPKGAPLKVGRTSF